MQGELSCGVRVGPEDVAENQTITICSWPLLFSINLFFNLGGSWDKQEAITSPAQEFWEEMNGRHSVTHGSSLKTREGASSQILHCRTSLRKAWAQDGERERASNVPHISRQYCLDCRQHTWIELIKESSHQSQKWAEINFNKVSGRAEGQIEGAHHILCVLGTQKREVSGPINEHEDD